jgi:predicted HAD superfamily Cof-like phosphohydrolase
MKVIHETPPGKRVEEFHNTFGVKHETSEELWNLRLDLTLEEMMEVAKAAGFEHDDDHGLALKGKFDPETLLKELCDLVYVAIGWCVFMGWDFDEAFKRVHASNMSKMPKDGKVLMREDGKILKPDTYAPPDLADLVK